MRFIGLLAIVGLWPAVLITGDAAAEVNIMQAAQLIQLKSDCALTALDRVGVSRGEIRFHGKCSNLSFYPDGIDVHCPDKEDDRTCRIMTEAKVFKYLDMFRQPQSDERQ